MIGSSSYLPIEEEIRQDIMDPASGIRAIKVVLDRRRPRLVASERVSASASVVDDLEKVFALVTDDEPCTLIIRIQDESKTVPGASEKLWIIIAWVPDCASPRLKTLLSTAPMSFQQNFVELKFKEVQASDTSDLVAELVLSAATDLVQQQTAELVRGLDDTRSDLSPCLQSPSSESERGEGPVLDSASPTLGIVRLDYNYPPIPGDIDCQLTYHYRVLYRCVPGLTFEMCQSGEMTPEVEREFIEAIQWLDGQGVCGITGDCGFMMYFQALARRHTKKPVFMSALMQLPSVTSSFAMNERIAIFTANSRTLEPMYPTINAECGVEAGADRFVTVGCEDVPGFEAVAQGKKVDPSVVAPGITAKARQVLEDHPDLRAILMECTELPHYSNAVRAATGLPVFDAITCTDLFMVGFLCNPRFGREGWQQGWDGKQCAYTLGDNLSQTERKELVSVLVEDESE